VTGAAGVGGSATGGAGVGAAGAVGAAGSDGPAGTTGGAGSTDAGAPAGASGGAGPGDGSPGDGALSDASAAVDAAAGDSGLTDPGRDGDGRFQVAKPAALPPEVMGRLPGVTAGTIRTLQIPAAMGFAARSVQVYTPSGYVPNTPVAFMVFHDGAQGIDVLKIPIIFDNLVFQKKLPLMVGIFIPPVSRSPEYDTVNDKYAQFITTQVLPAVASLNIKLTTDPEASGTAGHSSGGILAFTMAWFEPDRYRRVLSLSGSFLKLQTPGGDLYDNLVRTTTPLEPIRVAMTAGTNDLAAPKWTQANETMGAALMAAGYHHRYLLRTGGTHDPVENLPFLPEQLTWLWRGYPLGGPTR
jgi:enterochelin esterase-like enzyme